MPSTTGASALCRQGQVPLTVHPAWSSTLPAPAHQLGTAARSGESALFSSFQHLTVASLWHMTSGTDSPGQRPGPQLPHGPCKLCRRGHLDSPGGDGIRGSRLHVCFSKTARSRTRSGTREACGTTAGACSGADPDAVMRGGSSRNFQVIRSSLSSDRTALCGWGTHTGQSLWLQNSSWPGGLNSLSRERH